MDIEKTRLDRAVAILDASTNRGDDFAPFWKQVSEALSGFVLTGASEQVRQAIESFGVDCNEVMQRHRAPDTAADAPTDDRDVKKWDDAEVAKITKSVRELAELIRSDESQRILARLRQHQGVLPESEIIESRRHRDWFTDLLLGECQTVIAALAQTNEDDDEAKHNSIPFLSLFLFSEWNEARSVLVILQAFSLPGEKPFDLFGDAIHEQLSRYLAQFLADQPEQIDELNRNPHANPYVRWCSAGSYKYLVRDEAISLDDAVDRLDRLFKNQGRR